MKVTNAEVRVISVREPGPTPRALEPEDAAKYWRRHITRAPWYDDQREMGVVLCLNTRHDIISFSLVSLGTLNESIVHARDVYRAAIVQNAGSVIFMHNHPSGDARPGKTDQLLTRWLFEAGDFLRIRLIDHVIIGNATWYFSFVFANAVRTGVVVKSRMHRSRY